MASAHDRSEILDIIERQAERSGIPREDFLRFAYIETGGRFNADAHNTASGAKGLFQFMPGTAAEFGIAGREFDPAASTEAAAALYARNRNQIVNRQEATGHPFLSGAEAPNGLDMYLAHQQGGGGYASIQRAIATGAFSRDDTRANLLANVSGRDFERVTGQPHSTLATMDDRALATSFAQYWSAKYAAIEIADRGIVAGAAVGVGIQREAPLADGVLQRGERGDEVRALQESLNQLGFRDGEGAALEMRSGIYGQRTTEALRAFQQVNGLEASGNADTPTREAVAAQLALPEQARNRPPDRTTREDGAGTWPTPGNDRINAADKPREGRGEFGTPRSGGRSHGGLDIQGDVGDPVVAFAAGTVVARPNNGAAGNTVHVRHDDGSLTKYFHLDQFNVRHGQRVEAGQQVGTMGRTGNTPAQGDTHLHFELWRNGRQVDPLPALRGAERDVRAVDPGRAPEAGARLLRDGARGSDVLELQRSLNVLGVTDAQGRALGQDGVFGERTREAVTQLQRTHDLKVDGVVGRETVAKLASLAPAAARDPESGRTAAQRGVELRQQPDSKDGFVERMFSALREGDGQAVREVVQDYLGSSQGQAFGQATREPAPAPEPARDPSDHVR